MGRSDPFFISIPWEPPSSNLRRILLPDRLKSLRTPGPPLLSQGTEKSEHGPAVMSGVQRPLHLSGPLVCEGTGLGGEDLRWG